MDRQFISYPKSGRSWIRYVLWQLGCADLIRFHHDGFEFADPAKPAHSFAVAQRLERYDEASKVVYLDRDPRDVMVSLYHQITGRFSDVFSYQGNPSEFIRDPYFGAMVLSRFREMWKLVNARRNFLKISYEQCHSNMASVIGRLLDYYELEFHSSQISVAVGQAVFQNMKKIEEYEQFPEPWLQYRNGFPKIRQGMVGGSDSFFTKQDLEFLSTAFDRL